MEILLWWVVEDDDGGFRACGGSHFPSIQASGSLLLLLLS